MQPLADGRVEVRFALMDVVKQSLLTAMTYTVTPAQFRATAHKIADVIYEKLTGDPGVFSHAHRLHHQGGRALTSCWWPTPTAPTRRRSSPRNEPLLSPRWSPDGTRIAYVSFEQKKPVVYVQNLGHRRAPGGGQLPRQQQRARVVARRPPARGHAHQGRRLAALRDERRRQQRAARDDVQRHRHRGRVHRRRRLAPVHVRPRRQPADLSPQPRQRRRRAPDVRRLVQRVAAPAARRQGVRVRAPRRRPLPDRDPGFRRRARCRS